MKKATPAILALLLTAPAYGDALPGTLSGFHFLSNGVVILSTDGQRSDIPPCSRPDRFALDATTPGGKVQLAGLLAAHAAGKQVGIVGTGACSVYGDSETIGYFHIAD